MPRLFPQRLSAVFCSLSLTVSTLAAPTAYTPDVRRIERPSTEALTGRSLWMRHIIRDWKDAHEVVLWRPLFVGAEQGSDGWDISLLSKRWRPSPVSYAEDQSPSDSESTAVRIPAPHEVHLKSLSPEWVAIYHVPEIEAHRLAAVAEQKQFKVFVLGMADGDVLAQYKAFHRWAAQLPGAPSLLDVLSNPAHHVRLEQYFYVDVLPPLVAAGERFSTAYAAGTPATHIPDFYTAMNRYFALHRVSVIFSTPSLESWMSQMVVEHEHLMSDVDVTQGEDNVYLARMRRHMDAEFQNIRVVQRTLAVQRKALEAPGVYLLQVTLNPPGGEYAKADPLAHTPWQVALRARMMGRPLDRNAENLQFLRQVAFGYLNKILGKSRPDLPSATARALAARFANRWSGEDSLTLRHIRDAQALPQFLLRWIFNYTTPEDRDRLGVTLRTGPVPSITLPQGVDSAKAFSKLRALASPRPAVVHYHPALYDLLAQTNRGALNRIERILSRPFSDLTEGVDFDATSGARAVIVLLDTPVNINGITVAAIKLKGAVYIPQVAATAFSLAGMASLFYGPLQAAKGIRTFDVDPSGIYTPQPISFEPIGGARLSSVRHEAEVSLAAVADGFPTGVPLGWVEFPQSPLPNGQGTGAVLLGQPAVSSDRTTDTLNQRMEEFAQVNAAGKATEKQRRDLEEIFNAVFEALGHRTVLYALAGYAHTNFHLNNSSLENSAIFIHDNESTKRSIALTEEQYFAYLVIMLRNGWNSSFGMENHPNFAVLKGAWGYRWLRGFFGDIPVVIAKLFTLQAYDLILHSSTELSAPVWLMDHPIVDLLLDRLGAYTSNGKLCFATISHGRFLSAAS